MIEAKPVAWSNPSYSYIARATKDTVFGSHTIALFTADQLKEEVERAVLRCIDIAGFYADGAECKRLMTEQIQKLLDNQGSEANKIVP
jgi:hypothetical protein